MDRIARKLDASAKREIWQGKGGGDWGKYSLSGSLHAPLRLLVKIYISCFFCSLHSKLYYRVLPVLCFSFLSEGSKRVLRQHSLARLSGKPMEHWRNTSQVEWLSRKIRMNINKAPSTPCWRKLKMVFHSENASKCFPSTLRRRNFKAHTIVVAWSFSKSSVFKIGSFSKPRRQRRRERYLMPASHVEVGCPGTWGLELLTPNPGSKSTPKACPTRNPAMSPTRHTQPQPKHPSHRARSSVEIIITIIITPSHAKNATPKRHAK